MKKVKSALPAVVLLLSFSFLFSSTFQLEFYGGLGWLSPDNLNLLSSYQQNYENFYYHEALSYLEDKREISDLQETKEGTFKELKLGIPAGVRLKLKLTTKLSLSAGISYFSRQQSSEVTLTYSWKKQALSLERVNSYSPFEIYFKAISPTFGIHYLLPVKFRFQELESTLELFLAGGPVFVKVRNYYSLSSQLKSGFFPIEKINLVHSEEGQGRGALLEGGIRINLNFSEVSGIFLGASYRYCQASNFSGKGWEKITTGTQPGQENIERTEWEGDWAVKEFTFSEEWGEKTLKRPSNYTGEGVNYLSEFKLDLSGPQLVFGIFLKF